jgi:hypothetical protein
MHNMGSVVHSAKNGMRRGYNYGNSKIRRPISVIIFPLPVFHCRFVTLTGFLPRSTHSSAGASSGPVNTANQLI